MGTPSPEKDQRGNDDWFNRHGFKRWDKNANAFNDRVPRYNQLVSLRNELANRYEQKRQAHVALVEQHDQMAEQYKNQVNRIDTYRQ